MYYVDRKQSERICIIKVIATLLVVFIHMNNENVALSSGLVSVNVPYWLQIVKYVISSCIARSAVPFFFLFSSIFLYSKELKFLENIKKKFKTLCIPYLLCISCYILLFYTTQYIPVLAPYFSNSDNVIRNWGIVEWIDAYLGKIKHNEPFCVPLWFIRDLIILNIVSLVPKKIVDYFPQLTLILVTFIWLGKWQVPGIDEQAFVFWFYGLLLVKYNITMDIADKISWKTIIIVPILLFIDCRYRVLMLHQISIIVYMVYLIKASQIIYMSKAKQIFLVLIRYSLFTYMFHLLVITTMNKVAIRFIPQLPIIQLLEYCIFPFVAIIVCIFMAKSLQIICPQFYQILIGDRIE